MWNDIKAEYAPFIDENAFDAELDLWRHKNANIGLDADTFCKGHGRSIPASSMK